MMAMARIGLVLTAATLFTGNVFGDSARELLPSFDDTNLAKIDSWWKLQDGSPMPFSVVKLSWRISRLGETTLASRGPRSLMSTSVPLDIIELSGTATEIRQIKIPAELAESLEIENLWLVTVNTEENPIALLCVNVPKHWRTGGKLSQPIKATGVLVVSKSDASPTLIACQTPAWFPTVDSTPAARRGWTVLSAAGFDASKFDVIESRNRMTLSTKESAAFYEFLLAANRADTNAIEVIPVGPQNLLSGEKSGNKTTGEYIGLLLETARIQRIYDPKLISKFGQDHYWEIDAFGELGNVRVQMKSKDGEPISFGHRFPVTVIALNLPPFLQSLVQENGMTTKAMLMHKSMIDVRGFFYRLWSYETNFVSSQGGEKQIGPLVVATRITKRESAISENSVNMIGWVGAAIFIAGLAGIIIYLTKTGSTDRQARKLRQSTLPSELAIGSLDSGTNQSDS